MPFSTRGSCGSPGASALREYGRVTVVIDMEDVAAWVTPDPGGGATRSA